MNNDDELMTMNQQMTSKFIRWFGWIKSCFDAVPLSSC